MRIKPCPFTGESLNSHRIRTCVRYEVRIPDEKDDWLIEIDKKIKRAMEISEKLRVLLLEIHRQIYPFVEIFNMSTIVKDYTENLKRFFDVCGNTEDVIKIIYKNYHAKSAL